MRPATFAEIRELLLSRSPLPPLRPGAAFEESLAAAIDTLRVRILTKAALHLLNDDLERCHRIAQEHENPLGNYLHAVLHRREGDFENSLYWYNRVGGYPVLDQMRQACANWSPAHFVRWCEAGQGPADLLALQLTEMRLLLDTSREASSG
jgi:hypothetical protein